MPKFSLDRFFSHPSDKKDTEIVEHCTNITSLSCDLTHLWVDMSETYELWLVGSRGNATPVHCFGSIFPEVDSELISVCYLHTAIKAIAISLPCGRQVCKGAFELGPGLWPDPSAPPSLDFPMQEVGQSPGLLEDWRCLWKADIQALGPSTGRFVFQLNRKWGAGLHGLVSEQSQLSGPVFSLVLQPLPGIVPR